MSFKNQNIFVFIICKLILCDADAIAGDRRKRRRGKGNGGGRRNYAYGRRDARRGNTRGG